MKIRWVLWVTMWGGGVAKLSVRYIVILLLNTWKAQTCKHETDRFHCVWNLFEWTPTSSLHRIRYTARRAVMGAFGHGVRPASSQSSCSRLGVLECLCQIPSGVLECSGERHMDDLVFLTLTACTLLGPGCSQVRNKAEVMVTTWINDPRKPSSRPLYKLRIRDLVPAVSLLMMS